MFGLVFVLAAAQAAAAPPPVDASSDRIRHLPPWTESLEGKGWPFLDIDPTRSVVLFAKPDPNRQADSGLTRVLVRHEFKSDQPDKTNPTFRSEIIAAEIDCSKRGVRYMNDHRYTGRNLTGKDVLYRFSDSAWQTPAEGSFDEEVVQAACLQPDAQGEP